jgi:hypothetical protein
VIVPFAKGPMQAPSARDGQPMPSETNLLMALAEMHKNGSMLPSRGQPSPPAPELETK